MEHIFVTMQMKGSPGMSCGCCTDTACILQRMGPSTWMAPNGRSNVQTQVRQNQQLLTIWASCLKLTIWPLGIHMSGLYKSGVPWHANYSTLWERLSLEPILATGGWGDFFATGDKMVLDWTPEVEQTGGQECARVKASDVNDLLRKLDVSTAELDGMALAKVSCSHVLPANLGLLKAPYL